MIKCPRCEKEAEVDEYDILHCYDCDIEFILIKEGLYRIL